MDVDGESGFPRIGGSRALDLANTRPLVDEERVELLSTPSALRDWLHQAGFDDAEPTEEDLSRVLRLRDLATRIVDAHLAGRDQPPRTVVAELNGMLDSQPGTLRIVTTKADAELQFRPAATAQLPQHQLTCEVAELITDTDPHRLRRCDGPSCVLVFLDTTRNRSRRWCAMESCGNRAKAAAHYRRTRRANRP